MERPALQLVPHGPAALDALADTIAAAKGGDPVAPVTVAVPHPWAGLSLRRALAGRPGGVANVQFLVLSRVAELLGARALAAQGRRPRTPTVTRAAVRAVLRSEPGSVLARVADHPSTEAATVRLVDDIAALDPRGRARLAAAGPRPADLAALAERVFAAAGSRYDRHDQARAAADAVRRGDAAVADLGHLVVHLPTRLSPAEVELIAALADSERVTVLLGTTGDANADAPVRRLAERLAPLLGPPHEDGPAEPPLPQRIVSTTDPDDEVRAALRIVVAAWEDGTPLERMAVLYPAREPYARLLEGQAAAAGIPTAAASTGTLAGSVVGRTVLDALALPERGLQRDELMGWLAAAPMLDESGRRLPVGRWDVLSRRAGVVGGGIEAWHLHLDALLDRLAEDHVRSATLDPDAAGERYERDRSEVERLRAFVSRLHDELTEVSGSGSWDEMALWAGRFVRRLLGSESRWATWPTDQSEAAEAVLAALERVGGLDEVEPSPTLTSFRRALTAELDASPGRTGDFGKGLLVAPLHHGIALDLDVVVVVGLAEGTLPGRVAEDALLPDAERALADVDLPRRADAVDEQHHRLLAALAAAPSRAIVAPRGDLRQGRDRLPSRWLLDAASRHAGETVTTERFALGGLPHVEVVPSFAAGLARGPATSLAERDLADLLAWTARGRPASGHPLVDEIPGLGTGFEVLEARRRGGFTRFTGDVAGVEVPTFRAGASLSPTALERWATCPRRYFFAQVLRLHEQERPEVIDRMLATDRGSLVHDVLDRFFREVIERHAPKPPDESWGASERTRAREILEEVCSEYEQRGLTGRRVLWELDRDALRRDLERFLDADEVYRAAERAVPIDTELPFGPERPTRAELDLPGGRRVSFRGFADRVDRSEDGRLIVLDYKTGRLSSEVRDIERDDPVVRGTKLQLPVYALAAAAAHAPGAPVRAVYWHISDAGGFQQVGYDTSPARDARFAEVLTTIADGIEGGVFPGRPGDPDSRFGIGFANCSYCEFDRVCGRDRGVEWEQVKTSPALAALLRLTGEVEDEDEVEDGAPGGDVGAAPGGRR